MKTFIKNHFMNKKATIFTILLVGLILLLNSCYTPNPLYGTWADNDGNTITFQADGNFLATILNSSEEPVEYMGTYKVIDNVIIFDVSTGEESYKRNTEWDIRGAMLYLTWTANTFTKSITLYHISR